MLSTPDLSFNPLVDWLAEELDWQIYAEQPVGSPDNAEQRLAKGSTGLVNGAITELHQRILKSKNIGWYEHVQQPLIDDNSNCLEDIARIAKQLTSDADSVKQGNVIHDPLLCRFFTHWQAKVGAAKVIVHYSDPIQCALSLQDNWRMPIAVGLALWESYLIDACKSVVGQNYKLVSSRDLSQAQNPEIVGNSLASILSWLKDDEKTQENFNPFHWPKPNVIASDQQVDVAGLKSCLQKSHVEILGLLRKNNLNAVAERNLSFSSADTLKHYGQLRGALEHANSSRDSFKVEYFEQKKLNSQLELAAEAQRSRIAEQARPDEPQLETTQPPPQDNTPLEKTPSSVLCNVRVQIEGMDIIEFLSPTDSPVLGMLRTHMARSAEPNVNDELVYLNYGEAGSEALYFMSSSLMTLETELV